MKAKAKVYVFDCVNGELLFKILGKLGCPANFVQVIRTL